MRCASLALPALLLVAACSATGTPSPAATAPPAPGSTPAVAAASRPRSIPMAGVDPCGVFTDAQLTRLGVDPRDRSARQETDGNRAAPQCIWVTAGPAPSPTVYAQAVTFEGVGEARQRMTDPVARTVRGYPALLWEHSIDADDPGFEMYVDVADGQSLVVSCDVRGAQYRDLAMRNTETAADFAIANLLSR